jgi:predicted amidohydrolase
MKSSNTSDGRMLLDVNFEVGTDQDIANVLTQFLALGMPLADIIERASIRPLSAKKSSWAVRGRTKMRPRPISGSRTSKHRAL